jgi:PadR family transcriptional regulator PadR
MLPEGRTMHPDTQLLRGTLHVLILRTLSKGPRHGYSIARDIQSESEGALGIEDGALYQALHRMEERGWLESYWDHADSGKRARYYMITNEGRERLELETSSWLRYAAAVFKVLQPEGVRLEGVAS